VGPIATKRVNSKKPSILIDLGYEDYSIFRIMFLATRGDGISIIGGADIHIFVFTDCKNNRFQKKLIGQNRNI
jgi:hypothetical protein